MTYLQNLLFLLQQKLNLVYNSLERIAHTSLKLLAAEPEHSWLRYEILSNFIWDFFKSPCSHKMASQLLPLPTEATAIGCVPHSGWRTQPTAHTRRCQCHWWGQKSLPIRKYSFSTRSLKDYWGLRRCPSKASADAECPQGERMLIRI